MKIKAPEKKSQINPAWESSEQFWWPIHAREEELKKMVWKDPLTIKKAVEDALPN